VSAARALPAGLPRPRVVAALFTGRGAYRLAVYGAGLGLLALWGEAEFAGYATATGATAWVAALLAGGVEKAALALVPRPDGGSLRRLFGLLAVGPFGVLTAGWLAIAAVDPGGAAARYAAAAALTAGVGGCAVLVALYRLRGAPHVDALAHLGIAAAHAAVVALVAVARLGAHAVLAVLVGVLALVDAALLAGLWPDLRGAGAARPARTAALRAAVVLGAGELLAMVAGSLLFALFALAGDAARTSRFYVLLVVSSAVAVGWAYALRLAQPSLVGWLLRVGPAGGWRRARRLVDAALLAGAPAAAGLLVAGLVAGPGGWLAVAALAVEIGLYAVATTAAVVLENIDAPGRRWSAAGAVAHVATVAAAGWWLVPAAGAAGGLGALVAGELVRMAVLRGLVTRAARRRRGGP
jgi:hypothetical protein